MKLLKNQSGFSLVELLIASAILSVVALGFSTYMSNVNRQQKHVQETMDITQLNALVNAASIDAQSLWTSRNFSPALLSCITAPAFVKTASNPNRPISHFDCTPTPKDTTTEQLTNQSDKVYTAWNDQLVSGNSTTPITGFYTKKGSRCDGLTSATLNCPIAVRAKYVFTCKASTDINDNRNGKCPIAINVKVYRAIYQAMNIPGEQPLRTTVISDKGFSTGTTNAIPIPMAAITGVNKSAYKCDDLKDSSGAPLFQKGVDEFGYPICDKDTTVEIMREQICKQMMQNIWQNGGTSTEPCENITVTKVFPLAGNGYGKTTKDCQNITPAESRKLYKNENGTTIEIVDFNVSIYPGGILSGAITDTWTFKQKYGITSSSPQFTCKVRKETYKSNPNNLVWNSAVDKATFKLPDEYVPGSLHVTVVGGGSGGGGSNWAANGISGGSGGKAGKASINVNVWKAVTPGVTCQVTVGGGGGGGADGSKTASGPGGDTTITCQNKNGVFEGWNSGQAWVTGGPSVGLRDLDSGECGQDSNLLDETWGNSVGGGGSAWNCGEGWSATQPGAGGGGGGSKDCDTLATTKQFKGGSGKAGYAKVRSWIVYEWVPFQK